MISLSAVILCLVSLILPTSELTRTSDAVSSSRQGYIDVRSIMTYGTWLPQNETPTDVLNMISSMRNATNMNLNLYAVVRGPQETGQLIKGTDITVNSFLTDAQEAAGGQIIPELDTNYYTSNVPSLALNAGNKYCDPYNSTICGPSWFYEVSEEFLQLTPISTSTNKTVELDSWDQFNRDIVAAGLPANTTMVVLDTLHAEGWQTILIKSEMDFPGPQANGVAAPIDAVSTSPYMQPDLARLSEIASNQERFVHFDRQIQNSPVAPTSLFEFLTALNSSQQAISLQNLADLQNQDNYTFVYPVLTYTSRNNISYYWDANLENQSDGQTFLKLIESLLVEYGPPGSFTTSTSTTSETNSTTIVSITSSTVSTSTGVSSSLTSTTSSTDSSPTISSITSEPSTSSSSFASSPSTIMTTTMIQAVTSLSYFPSDQLPGTLTDQKGSVFTSTQTESVASSESSGTTAARSQSSETTPDYISHSQTIRATSINSISIVPSLGESVYETSSRSISSSFTVMNIELHPLTSTSSGDFEPTNSAPKVNTKSSTPIILGSAVSSVVFFGGLPFLRKRNTLRGRQDSVR